MMAHFAELDENNIVLRVIVVGDDDTTDENGIEKEQIGIEFCQNLLGGRWIQTSYSGSIRKRFASVGYTYNEELEAFVRPKPHLSWVLNLSTADWDPPFPAPKDDKLYVWQDYNDGTGAWVSA